MRSMRQLLLTWLWRHAITWLWLKGTGYGQNDGDTVQNGGAHVANFKKILQGHLFSKSHFFIKKTLNNYDVLLK